MADWQLIAEHPAPAGVEVKTKVIDEIGERCFQSLIFKDGQWLSPSQGLNVYWTPTHWQAN